MKAAEQREILEDNYSSFQLQENYAFREHLLSSQTARATQRRFEDSNVEVLKWPSQSPDLSPIENVARLVKGCWSPPTRDPHWLHAQKSAKGVDISAICFYAKWFYLIDVFLEIIFNIYITFLVMILVPKNFWAPYIVDHEKWFIK